MRSRAPIDWVKAEGLAREGMLVPGGIHEVTARAEVVITCLASVVALQQYYAAVAQGRFDEDHAAVGAAIERAANCER